MIRIWKKVLDQQHKVGMHENKEKIQLGRNHALFLGFDICAGQFSLDSYVEMQKKATGCVLKKRYTQTIELLQIVSTDVSESSSSSRTNAGCIEVQSDSRW